MTKVTTILALLILLTSFSVGSAFYESEGLEFDIRNVTDGLVWNESVFDDTDSVNVTTMSVADIGTTRLVNVIFKGVNFMMYASFEGLKFGIEAGFKHGGEYDFMFLMTMLKAAIILMVVIPLMYIVIGVSLLAYSLYGPCKRAWQKFRGRKR